MNNWLKGLIAGVLLIYNTTSLAQTKKLTKLQFRIEKVMVSAKDSVHPHPYQWVTTDSFMNNKVITIDIDKKLMILPADLHYHDTLAIVSIQQGYAEDEGGATMAIFHYKDRDGNLKKYSLYYTIGDENHKAYYSSFDEDSKTIYEYLLTWVSGTAY
jgi:hypothetical protein